MHLVFYSPQTLPSIGGLQYVVHYWAEALALRGHTITVITNTPADGAGDAGLSYRVMRNAGWLRQLKAMRASDKVVMFNVSLKGLPLVLLSGKPLYVTHHTALWYDGGQRPWRQRLKQWVANTLAAGNCACSGYIAALYKKCRVIYSPYRSDVFVPGHAERKPASILFTGRLVSDKGVDLLLQACGILKKEGLYFTLTIVGDGPDRAMLEQLASQLGLSFINAPSGINAESYVFEDAATPSPVRGRAGEGAIIPPPGSWRGALPQPDLVRHMQTHEIMVVPSRMEPMGMVIAEGLACGCRLVVSNQGGMPEVGAAFCRYFESGNAVSLANGLRDELSHPFEVDREALAAHLQMFTISFSVEQLEDWLVPPPVAEAAS